MELMTHGEPETPHVSHVLTMGPWIYDDIMMIYDWAQDKSVPFFNVR